MDNHKSPRLSESKSKDTNVFSMGNCTTGGPLPGRPTGKRIDTRKYLNSQLKGVDFAGKSKSSRSGDQGIVGNATRSRVIRTKSMLQTNSEEIRYMHVDVGQANHLEVTQAKAVDLLTSPAPQTAKVSRNAEASRQHGDENNPEFLLRNVPQVKSVLKPHWRNLDDGKLYRHPPEMVSAVSRNGSSEIDSFNDSAQMGDGLGPSSNGSGVEIRSDEDQLESLSAADSVDKSIIIDSSDTSTTTTEWPGDNHEIFSKESLPLESKIVWREGLVQRWEGLRNGEIDALLLLSSCADRDQTFPRATRSHRLGGKPELCPSSPGSDSSTSSNLSSFKPMLPGYSLRMRNKSFIPSNQHSEATTDHALKSHKVAANPAVANGNPFQQICSQACSCSVPGCLDIKHLNNCGFLKPEQKENLHNMVLCDSSVQHKLSPLKIPPSCSDPRRNSACRRDDSYYAYSNDYEGRRYAILQNCYHCDSHAKLLSSKLMARCAGTDQPIEAQISEYPKHGASLTKGVIVRPSVATHTAVENGTHSTFNYRSTSDPSKSCRVPPIQEQLLSQRSSNCLTNGLDHYNTRKSASRSSQKASVDEVLELQGVRDVHVVETPQQMEAAHGLSLFPSSSPVESPTELRTADLIGIPKPNAGFSDSESIRMEHKSKKCSRDISNDNPRCSVRMSSTIHHRCKADLPGWQAEHKPQISIPTTADSTKQFTSKLDETAISEKFCRCQQHSQAVENKAERDSAITQNCDSTSYMHFIAATASAGLLVVGACVIGYVCHRRFRRFRG